MPRTPLVDRHGGVANGHHLGVAGAVHLAHVPDLQKFAHNVPPMAVAGSILAMRRSENKAPTTPATMVKMPMVIRVWVRKSVGTVAGMTRPASLAEVPNPG